MREGGPDLRGSQPEPVFVWVGNLPATREDQQSVLKTRGPCLCFPDDKKEEGSETQLGVLGDSRGLDGCGHHKGRLWSPGPGLATLRGAFHFLPPGHHFYLPWGRRRWGRPEKTPPALCSLPARWTKLCPLSVFLSHLTPAWLHSADLAKGGRMQSSREGRRD